MASVASRAIPGVRLAQRSWMISACFVISDMAALAIAYWAAVLGRYFINPNIDLFFYLSLFPVVALFLLAFYVQDLYPGLLMHPVEEIRRVSHSVTFVFLLVAAATFISREASAYSRSVFLVAWMLGVPAVLLCRLMVRTTFADAPWWGIPAVILGSGPTARRIVANLKLRQTGLRIAGILSDDTDREWAHEDGPEWLGTIELAPVLASQRMIRYAIVAMPQKTNAELSAVIQKYCHGFRHVLVIPDLMTLSSLGVSAKDVAGELGIEIPQRLFQRLPGIIKRSVDVAGSGIGLILFSPFFLVMGVLIKLSSPGPVFYGHARHGRDGGVFEALKFRTMVTHGDEILEAYFEQHPGERAHWEREHKLKSDPRVTPIGNFLRRYSLDELPQLWNVWTGQMSLVGPRPIVPNEVDKYGNSFSLCTMVRPGITGLWQVSGRNNLSFPERIRLNEYYIRNWSIWLDLFILFKTITTVLSGEGAY